MNLTPNEFYHIYNRGNNKQKIFFSDDNYIFFLKKIRHQILPVCKIISYCLMPNHFHFIVMATDKSAIERTSFGGNPMQEFPYRLGILLSSYAQAINKQSKTTGSLFQQKILLKELENQKKISGIRNGSLCDKELFFSLTGLTANDVILGVKAEIDENNIQKFY